VKAEFSISLATTLSTPKAARKRRSGTASSPRCCRGIRPGGFTPRCRRACSAWKRGGTRSSRSVFRVGARAKRTVAQRRVDRIDRIDRIAAAARTTLGLRPVLNARQIGLQGALKPIQPASENTATALFNCRA
jgi:hypothetical protein